MTARMFGWTVPALLVAVPCAEVCLAQVTAKVPPMTRRVQDYEVTVATIERTDYFPDSTRFTTGLRAGSGEIVFVLKLRITSPNGQARVSGPFTLIDATGHSYESPFVDLGFIGEEGKPGTSGDLPLPFRAPQSAEIKSLAIGETIFDIQGLVKAANQKK